MVVMVFVVVVLALLSWSSLSQSLSLVVPFVVVDLAPLDRYDDACCLVVVAGVSVDVSAVAAA
eukprot:10681686-Alexandrium_andersonii.AAC.1